MRKSMKQRVALFLSFAMAFTSVDSSVLVAASDVTEVVSEETHDHDHDHEEEQTALQVEEAQPDTGEEVLAEEDEDISLETEVDSDVAEEVLDADGYSGEGEQILDEEEVPLTEVPLPDTSETDSTSESTPESTIASISVVPESIGRPYIAGLDGWVINNSEITITYADGSAYKITINYDSQITDERGHLLKLYLRDTADGNAEYDVYNSSIPVGMYELVLKENDITYTTGATYQFADVEDVTLSELQVGGIEVVSGEHASNWYRFTAPETAMYWVKKISNMSVYEKTDTGMRWVGNQHFEAEKGKTYYIGFQYGRQNEETYETEYTWRTELATVEKKVASAELISTFNTQYIEGLYNYVGNQVTLLLTYTDGSTEELKSRGSGVIISEAGNSINIELKKADGSWISSYEPPAGTYGIKVTADGEEVLNLDGVFTVGTAAEITLPELTTGSNNIQSGQYETKWYQFTAPKTATYIFSETVQYWYMRTETGVESLHYGGNTLNATEGTTYYAGFSGTFWDSATQTRRYETVLDISKTPEIESITVDKLTTTELIYGIGGSDIGPIELKITYDTGDTKSILAYGDHSWDGNGNSITMKWKSQESDKEYDSGETLPAGNYVIAFYVNDKACGTSADSVTVTTFAEISKGDLIEGENTITTPVDEDKFNWYRFVAPETGRYRFSRVNDMSIYQQKENEVVHISDSNNGFKATKGNTYYIGFCGVIYDDDDEEVNTWTTTLSRGLYVKSMEVVPARTIFYSGRWSNYVQLSELKVTYNDDTTITLKDVQGGRSIDSYGNSINAVITSVDDDNEHFGTMYDLSAGTYTVRVVMSDDREIGASPYQISVEEEPTPFNGKANVTELELGKKASVTLTEEMPYGWFSYTPESDMKIVYRERGRQYGEVKIFDKDGEEIDRSWGWNQDVPITLNAGGTYYFETILSEYEDEDDTRTVWIVEALDIQSLEVLETDLKSVYLTDESKPAPYVLAKATYKDGTSQNVRRNGRDDFGNRIKGEILDATGNVVTKCSEPGTYTYQIRSGEATAVAGTFQVKTAEDLASTEITEEEQQIDATDSNKMSYRFSVAEEGIYQLNANVPFEKLRIYTQKNVLKDVEYNQTYTAYATLEPGTYYVAGDVDTQITKLRVSVKKAVLPEKAEVYVSKDNLIAGVDDLETSNYSTKVSYTDQTQTWISGENGDAYGNRFEYQLKDANGEEWEFYEDIPAGTYTVKPVVFRTGTWAYDDESVDNQLLNKVLKEENKKSATLHVVKPDVSSMTAIEENQDVAVSGNTRRVFYKFTPKEDGDYAVKYENETVDNVVFLADEKDRFEMIGNSMHGKAGTTYVVMASRYSDFSFRIEKEGTNQNKRSVKELKVVSNKKLFYYEDSYDWHDDIYRYYLEVKYEGRENETDTYYVDWDYDESETTYIDEYGNTFTLTCKLTDEKVEDQYTVTVVCGDKSSSETMKYVAVGDHATALKVGEEKQSNAEQLYSFTPQETGEYTFRIIAKDWGVELGQFLTWVNLKKENRVESAGSVTAVASAQLRKGETYYFDVIDNRENKSDTSYTITVLKPEKKIADVQIVDAEKNLKVYKGIGLSNLNNLKAKIVYADGTEKTISEGEIDEEGRFLSVANEYWVNTDTYRVIVSFGKYRAYVDLVAQPWDNSQELQLAKAVAGRTDTDVSLYTFTPAQSGTYQFKVDGIAQWAAEVYDSKTGQHVYPWYGVLELQAGTTYNVAIYNYYHAGDAFTVTINKENETEEHVHSYVEDTKEATCEEAGYTQQKCSTCGEIKSGSYKEIPALGHDWQETVIEEATATKDGIKALVCSRCQKEKENSREPIPMTGHKMGDWTVTKEPTCTEDGISTRKCENENCTICNGTPYVETELIAATGHRFGTWSITKEATCTEEGTMTRSCRACNKKESAAIPALGHQYKEETKEATCTKAGYTQEKCSVCESVQEGSYKEIPALGHDYGDWSISKAATCTEAGKQLKVCSRCGDKQSEAIPATGHNYETDSKAATCIEAGYTQKKCTVCGNIQEGSREEIKALGHTYGDKVITKAATCTENGTYTQTCTRCGNEITGLEPMTGHTFKEDKKEPTCEETGYTQNICEVCGTIEDYTLIPAKGHTYETRVIKAATDTTEGEQADFCTVCGKEKPGSRTIIPMTAHQMGEWKVTKEATCTEEGSRERTCVYENCTLCKDGERYTQTETIAKLPHSYKEEKKEATCTTAGYTQLVCENCKEVKEGSYKKLEATGHIFGVGQITLEPTCTSQGLITFTCTKCKAKRIGVLPEKDHAWNSTPTVEKQATCSTEGEQDIRCKDCNAVKDGSTTKIPKIAHQWNAEVTIDKQATCTENGQQSIHCKNCNAVLDGSVAVIPATGHTFAEKVTPATCTSNGKIEKECTVCGEKQTEELAKLGHDMKLDAESSTAATCTDDGLLVYTCQNDGCGKKEYATRSALDHNWSEEVTKEATDEANGKVYKVCNRCQEEEIVSILPRKAQQELIDIAKADATSTAKAIEAIKQIDNEILLDNTTKNLVETVEQKLLKAGVDGTTYAPTTVAGDLSDNATVTGAAITAATANTSQAGTQSMLATFALDNRVTSTVTVNKGNTGTTEAGKAYMDMRLSMTVDNNPVTTLAAPITLTLTAPEAYRGTNATVTTLSGDKQKITVAKDGTFTFTATELETVRLTVESCIGDHAWDPAKATKATCTDAATRTCGKCGKKEVSTTELATGHNYSVVVDSETKEATCEATGSQTLKCANCDATTTKTLPVSKIHTYTAWTATTQATCTTNGVETSACDVCGNKTERVLKATGHKFADTYTTDTAPTCTEAGSESRHCLNANCNATTAARPIAATGHQLPDEKDLKWTPATACLEKATANCSKCGAELQTLTRTATNPSAHNWDETKTVREESTCTTAGSETKTCADCGTTVTTPLALEAHTMTKTEAKAATCVADGNKEYWTCSECHQIFSDADGKNVTTTAQVTVKATGKHNKVTVIDRQSTCGAAGSQHLECSICHAKDPATSIPATGKHSFGEYKVTKEATVQAAGTKTRTCSVCGKTETQAIAKLPGSVALTTGKLPLQLKKTVQLSKILTGTAEGDYIASCASANTKVATVNASGKVTAKAAGSAVITITMASGATAKVTVTVQKKAVATASIKNVEKKWNAKQGEKKQLTPVISPVSTLDKVTYTSSNKKVATVSKSGLITAKKSGTAKITVKSGKKKVTVTVKVAKAAPTGIKGVAASKTLKKGKSFTIKAKLTPSGAEAKISFKSSNKKVATVNAKGKVTAKGPGTAVITVKAGSITKTCTITVK